MKKICIAEIRLTGLSIDQKQVKQLRGAISNKFPKNDLFHNHSPSGCIYRAPLIQYKTINGTPLIQIICREDMTEKFHDAVENVFSNLDEITLGKSFIKIEEKDLKFHNYDIGVDNKTRTYKILSPMILFNENTYQAFYRSTAKEKIELAEKILRNNILSLFDKKFIGRGLVVENIDKVIDVSFLKFQQGKVYHKKVNHISVRGIFSCNVCIPQYFSIGKKKSIGYGTVYRQN